MKIYYGIANNNIDVTNVCLQRLTCNDAIEIPSGDATRSVYFTNPLDGVHKFIIIVTNNMIIVFQYIHNKTITLNSFFLNERSKPYGLTYSESFS